MDSQKQNVSWIKELNGIFNKKQKLQFLGLFFIEFIGSLLELLGVSILIPFMELVMEPDRLISKPIVQNIMTKLGIRDARELIMVLILCMILIFAVKNVYLVFMAYMQQQITCNNRAEMELQMMAHYVRQPYSFHVNHSTAEIQRTVLTDVGIVFEVMANVFMIIAETLTSGMLIVMLLMQDVMITLVTILFLAFFILIYFKVFKKRLYRYGQVNQEYGTEVIKNLNQIFHGIKEIKVYRSENYFLEGFANARRVQIRMTKRGNFFQATPRYFMELIVTCGVLLMVYLKLLSGANITDLVVQLSIFAMAAFRILPSANRITSELALVFNNKTSVDVVYAAIHEDQIQLANKYVGVTQEDVQIHDSNNMGDISVEHMSFHYPDSDKMILEDVSFEVKGGTSVALKGPSGAGKTTTADLILGILNPTAGRILYEGKSIQELGADWYEHIGYIPQSIYLSDDTIRANVAFGVPNPDDTRVWKALEEAQLKEFVADLPEGLDSTIGENGVRISGGQRQRIGIARALYRNPEILILDEATSALDNETEKAVMESIDYLKGKKTLIIIAHRLTTIENCDVVYEVSGGKIKA